MLVLTYCTSSVITDTTQCFWICFKRLRSFGRQHKTKLSFASRLFLSFPLGDSPLGIKQNWNNPIEGWIPPTQLQPYESPILTAFPLRPLVDNGLDAFPTQRWGSVTFCFGLSERRCWDLTLRSHIHYHVLCHWATFQPYFYRVSNRSFLKGKLLQR